MTVIDAHGGLPQIPLTLKMSKMNASAACFVLVRSGQGATRYTHSGPRIKQRRIHIRLRESPSDSEPRESAAPISTHEITKHQERCQPNSH